MKTPLVIAAMTLLALPLQAADWPNFRGPNSSGISDEKNLPTTWSDTENLVWKVDLPGPGSSSPIVWGDKVFVTCYTGYGLDEDNPGDQDKLQRHLLGVDRKTGNVLWNKAVPAKLPEPEFSSFQALHGYASSTPATDGERVYVFYGKSGVLAYDFAGQELWRANVGDSDFYWGVGSSPLSQGTGDRQRLRRKRCSDRSRWQDRPGAVEVERPGWLLGDAGAGPRAGRSSRRSCSACPTR